MSAVVHTFFDRKAIPTNLLTVAEWRTFARAIKKSSWETAARHYANQVGGALVVRADDSLVVFTKLTSGPRAGKLRKQTYKPGKWSFETPA